MVSMRKSRLSSYKQGRLIEHFVSGTTARTAASMVRVNKSLSVYFYHQLREIIAYELSPMCPEVFDGEIEVESSYFGGRRKGKRGRGAAGNPPVFGLLKRGGKVYTKIIADAASMTLIPIIERKAIPDSIVYTDCWRGYNVLNVSDFKPQRAQAPSYQSQQTFADNEESHQRYLCPLGIENFCNQVKRHMRKFNGVPKAHFGLFLKECEWRFNNSTPTSQLLQLRQWVRVYLIWLSRTAPKCILN